MYTSIKNSGTATMKHLLISATTKPTPRCGDSLNDCALLNQTTGICNSQESARKLCPEFCGLCSIGKIVLLYLKSALTQQLIFVQIDTSNKDKTSYIFSIS